MDIFYSNYIKLILVTLIGIREQRLGFISIGANLGNSQGMINHIIVKEFQRNAFSWVRNIFIFRKYKRKQNWIDENPFNNHRESNRWFNFLKFLKVL